MGRLFDLEADGYFYTRLQNPTNDLVAERIRALEGGVAAMLTSSGQAANFFAVFNLCETGDHFIASSAIYGGTFNLFGVTMIRSGNEGANLIAQTIGGSITGFVDMMNQAAQNLGCTNTHFANANGLHAVPLWL